MSIKTRALGALLGVFAFASLATAADRPYTEGNVVQVTAVRTEPGMFDEYMKYLAGPYRQIMEGQKKAGIIVDYSFYSAVPRGPQDADLYIVTVYKNMAALDGLDAKADPIVEGIMGSMEQQSTATVQRGKLRTILGDEFIRQLVLK
jgi:hypothetical protein